MQDNSREDAEEGLTSSVWFWGCLFSLVGLAATFAMGSKHFSRQERLERMNWSRQIVLRHSQGDHSQDEAELPEPGSLWPLRSLLIAGLVVSAIKLAVECRGRDDARTTGSGALDESSDQAAAQP